MTYPAVSPRLAMMAGWTAGLRGWKRLGLAVLAGAVATLALPPAHALPLLWVAFPMLAWLLRGSDRVWCDFAIGFAFGVGHHVPGLYWISAALFTDIGRFWFMLPFALVGLPALLGLFLGAGTAVHGWARRRFGLTGWTEAVALGLAWVAVEYARGHMFTGFPWNLLGYGWVPVLPVLQFASVAGIYGLSLLTVLVAVLPATLAGPAPSWRPVLAGVAVLGLVAVWGGWRMAGQGLGNVPGVTLRVVQPNIPQELKWKEEAKINNLRHLIALSGAEGWDQVTHVIWPETAVPYFLSSDNANANADQQPLTRLLTQIAPPAGALITGGNRLGTDAAGNYIYFNSLFALTQGGHVAASFDKFHLVPFGEYLPLRSLLPKGMKAVAAGADFSAGPGPQALPLPGAPPASPLICYEVIFPGAVMPREGERPHWLLNLTNDAWYGRTAGPHQHFAITIVRAVEEGVPLVRAANTGISGVIDAYGRVRGSIPLGDSGNLDISLPQRADFVPLYADFGNLIPALIWLGLLLAIIGQGRRREAA